MSHQYDRYSQADRNPKSGGELTRADPIAWGSHMPAQPDGVFANGNFLDHKVAADLLQSRRANFQREWPLIPSPVRLRLRELSRFPTRDNHNNCSGFIAGYTACKPGAFSDSYAQALAFALYSKDSWAIDEVQHARVSD